MLKRLSVVGTLVAVLCAGFVITAPRAPAAPAFPWYSVGAYYDNLQGVATTRYDLNITANAACPSGGAIGAPAVQQWERVYVGNSSTYIEAGTEHFTASCKRWYMGYFQAGIWHRVFTGPPIAYGQHRFALTRSGATWSFVIDTTTVKSISWLNQNGYTVQVGIASWSNVNVPAHGDYDLQIVGPTGFWEWWINPGQEAAYVTAGAPICGRFFTKPGGIANDSWQSAQNYPCT